MAWCWQQEADRRPPSHHISLLSSTTEFPRLSDVITFDKQVSSTNDRLTVCDCLIRCRLRTTFSTNAGKPVAARTRFPALGAGYMHLLPVLIGSSRCLRPLRLVEVVTFGFAFFKKVFLLGGIVLNWVILYSAHLTIPRVYPHFVQLPNAEFRLHFLIPLSFNFYSYKRLEGL